MAILVLNRVLKSWCDYKEIFQELIKDIVFFTDEQVANDFKEEGFLHFEIFQDYRQNLMIPIRALELHEQYNFTKVIALSEFDIIRAAEIRTMLGIKGQQVASAMQFRDKVLMKEIIRAKSSVRVPNFAKISSVFDLIRFINGNGFPVVVKPVDGFASMGISILRDKNEFIKYIQTGVTHNVEVEEYIEGDTYHIDGMICEGEIKLICASRYTNNLVSFSDEHFISASYLLHPENLVHQRLVDSTTEILKSLDTPKNTVFHAECFLTPEGQVVFCEIASRPGGGRITKMIDVAYGYDPMIEMVKLQAGIPFTNNLVGHIPSKLAAEVTAVAKKGKFVSYPRVAPPDWVREYLMNVEEGHVYTERTNFDDGPAFFVIEGDTEEEVVERIHLTLQWFDEHAVWELEETETVNF